VPPRRAPLPLRGYPSDTNREDEKEGSQVRPYGTEWILHSRMKLGQVRQGLSPPPYGKDVGRYRQAATYPMISRRATDPPPPSGGTSTGTKAIA
jgi:hypothetical protein